MNATRSTLRAESSEFAANETAARLALDSMARRLSHESNREDWRRVLAKRDAKRADRRTLRRSHVRNAPGFALAAVLGVQALAAAAVAIIARFA